MNTTKGIMLPAVMLLSTLILLFVASTFSIMFNDNITTAIAVETEGAKLAAKSGYQAALDEIEGLVSVRPFDPASISGYRGESGAWKPCSSFQKDNSTAEYCYAYSGNMIVAGGRVRGKNRKWVTRFLKTHYFLESRGIVTKELAYGDTIAEQNKNMSGLTEAPSLPSSEIGPDGTTIISSIDPPDPMNPASPASIPASPEKEKGGVQDQFGAFITSVYSAKAPFPLEAWIGGAPLSSHADLTKKIKFSGEYNIIQPETLIYTPLAELSDFKSAMKLLGKLHLQDDSWGKDGQKNKHIWILGKDTSAWDSAIKLALYTISFLKNTGGDVVLKHVSYSGLYDKTLEKLVGEYQTTYGGPPGTDAMKDLMDMSDKTVRPIIFKKFKDELKDDINNAINSLKWDISNQLAEESVRMNFLDGYSKATWDIVKAEFSKEILTIIGISDESKSLDDIISHHDILMAPESKLVKVGEDKVDGNWGGKYLWIYPKNDTVFIDGDLLLVNNAVLVTTGNIVINGNIRGNGVVISLSSIYMMPINRALGGLPPLDTDDNVIVYAAENVYLNNNYTFGNSSFDPALFAALPQEVVVKFSEFARQHQDPKKDFYELLWAYAKENPNEIPPSLMEIYFNKDPREYQEIISVPKPVIKPVIKPPPELPTP